MHLQITMCTLTWPGLLTPLDIDVAQMEAHGLLPALCRVSSAEALTHRRWALTDRYALL